jgi:hypothetical protein
MESLPGVQLEVLPGVQQEVQLEVQLEVQQEVQVEVGLLEEHRQEEAHHQHLRQEELHQI